MILVEVWNSRETEFKPYRDGFKVDEMTLDVLVWLEMSIIS